MDYETLRHFADSWGLALLLAVFVAIVAYVYRPGARDHFESQADMPLRDDD